MRATKAPSFPSTVVASTVVPKHRPCQAPSFYSSCHLIAQSPKAQAKGQKQGANPRSLSPNSQKKDFWDFIQSLNICLSEILTCLVLDLGFVLLAIRFWIWTFGNQGATAASTVAASTVVPKHRRSQAPSLQAPSLQAPSFPSTVVPKHRRCKHRRCKHRPCKKRRFQAPSLQASSFNRSCHLISESPKAKAIKPKAKKKKNPQPKKGMSQSHQGGSLKILSNQFQKSLSPNFQQKKRFLGFYSIFTCLPC
ncbi:hypothetical protein M885DRAFT_32917 [Pelagophyceae sp. CCMP2097]|nr:hypothetical protein M885DRAFT_32917 [Pelagophyceae sp. CCMP2097]